MANTADATASDATESVEAPKSKKKLIIIAGAAVLLLAGAGAGGYFFLKSPSSHAPSSEAATTAQPPKPAIFIDLQPMIVNLVSQNEKPAYLRITLALEISDEKLRAQIEPLMPRIMDAFQIQLRQMRASDFEGAAGVYRLKEELLRRINGRIYPAQVDGVLIKELLLQ